MKNRINQEKLIVSLTQKDKKESKLTLRQNTLGKIIFNRAYDSIE